MDAAGSGRVAETHPPSRLSGGWFAVKRTVLQLQRLSRDLAKPSSKLTQGSSVLPQVFERRSALYTQTDPVEKRLELGKVQNLRLVARCLNGVEVPAGATFSFWKQVGRCTRRRGFVSGRQIQEGCLMPAVGGGICQLTNALYALALEAGLEIVERHPHTRAVPGSSGPDATVAWNYIDLRFRSHRPFRIEAYLTKNELVVRICSLAGKNRILLPLAPSAKGKRANSCATCGQEQCHHWHEVERQEGTASTAFLVDQWLPEYGPVLDELAAEAILFRPLDGRRWKRSKYAWPVNGFARTREFTILALRRAFIQRRLAEQGAARQQALLAASQELAKAYAQALPFEVRHLVVSQSLLPFLWREGVLGGRTFDVLMSRLPMDEIHYRLDAVAAKHPERRLLSDFRAPDDIVSAESEALAASSRQITAHAEVARACNSPWLLPWPESGKLEWSPGRAIVFPGPTVARKGAYEVREAARALGLKVVLLGSELEGPMFWEGVQTRRASRGDKLEGVLAVVQPAVLEDRPIFLLKAHASGCPVICTSACGLPVGHMDIRPDDPEGLIAALQTLLLLREEPA